MNAVTQTATPPTKFDAFRMQVLPPEKASDLFKSLPAHIKPAVFERNLVNALMQNPGLMNYHPGLVYREVSKAAGLGLLLDPQLGEGYLIEGWNGRAGRKEPQLRIGYKGMCKLARQAGDVTNIYAHEACENDRFRCQLGTERSIDHEPDYKAERGNPVLYYAVIKFSDGSFDFDVMTVSDCQGIRDRSDAWKAFAAGKIKSTPWSTDESEMSKKTVLRRLLKRQPQSPELAAAISIEDGAEFPHMQRLPDEEPPPPSSARAIEHQPSEPMTMHPVRDPDVDMVEAGRDNGENVVWEDGAPPMGAYPDEDPPAPNAMPPMGQSAQSQAVQSNRTTLANTLIAEIGKIITFQGCIDWATRSAPRLRLLSDEARGIVNATLLAKQDGFKSAERKVRA